VSTSSGGHRAPGIARSVAPGIGEHDRAIGDTASVTFSDADVQALVGYRFPGGRYRIEHWENFLLTDCTGADQLPDGLVHPIALFHVPILGSGMTITKLFELGGAAAHSGSVGLEGYDWEYLRPLREDVDYVIEGGIVSAERKTTDTGQVYDAVAFTIELSDDEGVAARITNRWRFRRNLS